mmetsp:Transcript_12614/g.53252  ORF Transcript_12614/g.53252 Transcript_12614/m.53252 type:complete len:323 (-) Transcript_12614:683-1651(-)
MRAGIMLLPLVPEVPVVPVGARGSGAPRPEGVEPRPRRQPILVQFWIEPREMNERVCHRHQLHGRDHRVERSSRVGARGSRSRMVNAEPDGPGFLRTPQRRHVVPPPDAVLNQLYHAISGASAGVPVKRLRELPDEYRLRRVRLFIRDEPSPVVVNPVVDLDVARQSHCGVSREGQVGVRAQDRRLRRGDEVVSPGNESPQPRDRHQESGVPHAEPVRPQVVARRLVDVDLPIFPLARGVAQALGQHRAVYRLLHLCAIFKLAPSFRGPFLGTKRHSLRGVAAAISKREAGPAQRHLPRRFHHFIGSHALREREGRPAPGKQ